MRTGSNTSQSFPFLTALDGMVALLSDVKAMDYYEVRIKRDIPAATHLIVHNRRIRFPESIDPSKTYFGDVSLKNGTYEIMRDLKGNVSLIVPKPAPKDKLNIIPYSPDAKFSIKVSYKASELLPEHQNGELVTQLMADSPVTFNETTIDGNKQYCVHAGDTWVGTMFDDQANKWVLRKEVMKTLTGKDYSFVGVPRTGVNTNSNSFVTGNGAYRTAQVLTFAQA